MPRLLRPALAAILVGGLALAGCNRHKAAASHEEQQFLDKTAHQPGVVRLADGLEYRVVTSGPADGLHPAKGDEIKIEYTGSLVSGSVFDSTSATGTPAVMKLDHLIPAWMEALPKMRPGDEWLIYAPPELAYGAEGHPPVIPPNSVLVFDVKLLGVLKSDDNAGTKFAGAQPEGPSLQAPGNTAQ